MEESLRAGTVTQIHEELVVDFLDEGRFTFSQVHVLAGVSSLHSCRRILFICERGLLLTTGYTTR